MSPWKQYFDEEIQLFLTHCQPLCTKYHGGEEFPFTQLWDCSCRLLSSFSPLSPWGFTALILMTLFLAPQIKVRKSKGISLFTHPAN